MTTSRDISEKFANKHIARWNNKQWIDVEKLYPIAATKEYYLIPIEPDEVGRVNRSGSSGFSQERYNKADTSYPILIYDGGEGIEIVDGRHRYLKQKDTGEKYVKVIELSLEEIESCIIGEE